MPSNLSILLSAVLSATDQTLAPSATIVTRSLNNPNLQGTVALYDAFFQATNVATAVTLPATTCWVAYVKNLDAAANLTVSWTPVGVGAETFILVPGGVFIYFQPSEGAGGFSAMTLTASVAGPINTEVFVAK